MSGDSLEWQARLKDLSKTEPGVYITRLPASPVEYLQDYRAMALKVFSREHPPVRFPLNQELVDAFKTKIKMRGGDKGYVLTGGMPPGMFSMNGMDNMKMLTMMHGL